MNRNMCLRILVPFLVISTMPVAAVMASEETQATRLVEDFSRCEAGTFPEGWKCVRGGSQSQATETYKVRPEGGSYLAARAVNSDVLIARKFEYDLKEYPYLSWQWRALELPKGADERHKKTGDSAAGIYVIFPGRFRPDNIKYVWSTSLPEGTTTESPYNNKTKIIVLRNAATPLGTWVCEKVNAYEDYKRLFGREPEPVQAIGIMSDSNNTESTAAAHYKAIRISKQ